MHRFAIGSVTVLAALTVGVAGALPASAAPAAAGTGGRQLRQGPRFNIANGTKAQQGQLDSYVRQLVKRTPKGELIEVAMFRFTDWATARELVAAKRRGVRVRIVLDSQSNDRSGHGIYRYFVKYLGASTRKGSWVVLCPPGQGCIGRAPRRGQAKNHNKFYLFSRSYDSRNVVVQTSRNATVTKYAQWNDLYTMTNPRMYRSFRRYFADLSRHRPNRNYWRGLTLRGRSVRYLPKASGDPIVTTLNAVRCFGGTRVRVSSGIFTRAEIARRLWALDDAGCAVQVVTTSYGASVLRELTRRGGRHNGPEVRYFKGNSYAHSKYLLIDGWLTSGYHRLVVTGSHSYTTAALRNNDEVLLTLEESGSFNQYTGNYKRVFADAKGRVSPRLNGSPLLTAVVPTVPDDADETDPGE